MLSQQEMAEFLKRADEADKEGKLGGGEFEDLPLGDYYGTIDEAIRKESKAGNDMVQLTILITDGKYKGRKHWVYYTLEHANPTVVQIAIESLNKLAKSLGIVPKENSIADYDLTEQVLPAMLDVEIQFSIKESKSGFINTVVKAI